MIENNSNESIYLYNLTLKHPSHYIHSFVGQFFGIKKSQELLVASPTHLQLLIPNAETGKLELKLSQQLFGTINRIDKIQLSSQENLKDGIVVTSDSGNLSILEYNKTKNKFIPIVQEPMAKNGWGRTYPGEYLAVDPSNRCILVGATERNKLVYRLETRNENELDISSPLEANTKEQLCLNLVALSTEYENPQFAAIEVNSNNEVIMNYYEFDLGLNHIVKKFPTNSELLPQDMNHLIPLPGSIGGMLICGKNWVVYDKLGSERLYLPLPQREGQDSIIVNSVIHQLKKGKFFILMQNSLGDLFKVVVDYNKDKEIIDDIKITYFDTIPPSISLNIFKSGFLFANVLNNDKLLYQFEKLGDDEESMIIKSSDYSSFESVMTCSPQHFTLRALDNLALIDIVDSLGPIMDAKLNDTHQQDKQLVTLSSHSFVKTIVHGIQTSTIVESPLPFVPTDIFTTKLTEKSIDDEYLVISSSLSSKTLVLSIGEVVEGVEDSQFITDQLTLAVQQLGKSSVAQVYSNGIRHIRHLDDSKKTTTDWFAPAGISVLKASTNNQQVIIGLSNSEVVYFEIDPTDDQLIEYQERLELSSPITSLAILPERSPFAVIGCADETIQVISLQSHNCLEMKSMQALSSNSSSVVMLLSNKGSSILVHIGMENGVYVRTRLDHITGKLSDSRIKYLGSRPVNLTQIQLASNLVGVLAISSKPWVSYPFGDTYKVTPLLNIDIRSGASFVSEDIGGEGIVGIRDNNLIIFTVGGKDEDSIFDPSQDLSIDKLKLRYPPKKIIAEGDLTCVMESEYGVKGPYSPTNLLEKENNNTKVDDVDQDYYDVFGYKKTEGSWASCVQVVQNDEVVQTVEFTASEAPISITKVTFKGNNQPYLIVGIVTHQKFLPNGHDSSYLYTFKINKKKGPPLQFLHKTDLDFAPTVLSAYNDKLLIASGNYLRLYDLGQKQLLRKSSSQIDYLSSIVKIEHVGNDRIIIGDSHTSVFTFAKFDTNENCFIPFADDITKRQLTAMSSLDYDTVIGGDKFGNIFISRLDGNVSRQSDEDWTLLKNQDPNLNSVSFKLNNIAEFYLQDIPVSFQRGSFNIGGQECVAYCGLMGTVGILIPLLSKLEVELLQKLELATRKVFDYNFDDFDKENMEYNALGKDHLKFRSYYNPVRNVIDGDLLERYLELSPGIKIKLARELSRTPNEIEKKLIDIRNRSAF